MRRERDRLIHSLARDPRSWTGASSELIVRDDSVEDYESRSSSTLNPIQTSISYSRYELGLTDNFSEADPRYCWEEAEITWNKVCSRCNAKLLPFERPGMCCENGKMSHLQPFQVPQGEVGELFTGTSRIAKLFRKWGKGLNNTFCFSVLVKTTVPEREPNFVVHGKVHQSLSSLNPGLHDESPRYGSIYFLDPAEQLRVRKRNFDANSRVQASYREEIVDILQRYISEYHQYSEVYKKASELRSHAPEISIVFFEPAKTRETRNFLCPLVEEIAGLYDDSSHAMANHPGVIVNSRAGDRPRRVDIRSAHYEPLGYPLLFLDGESGWHPGRRLSSGRMLTLQMWVRFHLMERVGSASRFLCSGALLAQYVVDMKLRVDAMRHQWYRKNQDRLHLRVDTLENVSQAEGDDPHALGRRVILTSSLTGSPRYYTQLFHEAMALVREFGKPDLFLTITCDSNWQELDMLNGMSDGSSEMRNARIDVLSRVFNSKLNQICREIMVDGIFGKVSAHTYAVEWQKRGSPHCHIILWLENKHALDRPEDIDRIIKAEIPDDSNPRYLSAVKSFMIHNVCGSSNPKAPCNTEVNGRVICSKRFPMAFCDATVVGENAYAQYRRRSPAAGGRYYTKRFKGSEVEVNNSWVVPHNPYLLTKYRCHMNLEKIVSVKALKYVFKYLYKGADRIMYRAMPADPCPQNNNRDEVTWWENARYMSSFEAVWSLLELPRHSQKPAVEPLDLHLPEQQRILFDANNGRRGHADQQTTLLAYFELNVSDPLARPLLYRDIPKYYTFGPLKKWRRRRQGKLDVSVGLKRSDKVGYVPGVIGCSRNKELHALYVLLNHTAGSRSFLDLRTVEGVVHETFREAACARLLLRQDTEADLAFSEANRTLTGTRLRRFFVRLLVFWGLDDPSSFYERVKWSLQMDILRVPRLQDSLVEPQSQISVDEVERRLLRGLNSALGRYGKSLDTFGLPNPEGLGVQECLDDYAVSYVAEPSELETAVATLNAEQRIVFDTIVGSVSEGRGEFVFVDAPGGTGKTYLLNILIKFLANSGKKVVATASSGVASNLLIGGRTLHSKFRLPLKVTDSSVCNITKQSELARAISRIDLLIWDEAPMFGKKVLETLDRTLRDLRSNPEQLFGGVTVLLAGDFRQILPVVKHGWRPQIVSSTLKASVLWSHVGILGLTRNMRVGGDSPEADEFRRFLLSVGDGTINDSVSGNEDDKILIPSDMVLNDSDPISLCRAVFEDLADRSVQPGYHGWVSGRAIIVSTNGEAARFNQLLIDSLPGDVAEALSTDEVVADETGNLRDVPIDFLNKLELPGLPPHRLALKRGAPIILTTNVDVSEGHCNGTRYVVKDISRNLLVAQVTSGPAVGEYLYLGRFQFFSSEVDFPVPFSRTQFPVRLAFAITANRAQGQTLTMVGISLLKDFFTHGQLYVAMSRCKSRDSLKVLCPPERSGSSRRRTTNIVFREVFENS